MKRFVLSLLSIAVVGLVSLQAQAGFSSFSPTDLPQTQDDGFLQLSSFSFTGELASDSIVPTSIGTGANNRSYNVQYNFNPAITTGQTVTMDFSGLTLQSGWYFSGLQFNVTGSGSASMSGNVVANGQTASSTNGNGSFVAITGKPTSLTFDSTATFDLSAGGSGNSFGVYFEISKDAGAVPEPTTMAIFALGMGGIAARRFRKR
jgi:hypothetical protein